MLLTVQGRLCSHLCLKHQEADVCYMLAKTVPHIGTVRNAKEQHATAEREEEHLTDQSEAACISA